MLDRGRSYTFPDISTEFPAGMEMSGMFNPVADLDISRMANITIPKPTDQQTYGMNSIGPEMYLQQNLKKTARQPQINQLLMLVDLLRRSPSVPPPQ